MQTAIVIGLLLLTGLVLNSASAFTAAFSRRWGARPGQWITLVLRVGLGMPLWISGLVLAVRLPGQRLVPAHPLADMAGWFLIACGATLVVWAVPAVGRRALAPSMADTLVVSGPYAYVRHPVYSGGLLEFAGLALLRPTPVFVLVCGICGLWLVAQAWLEERDLLQRLPGYADYIRRVPRFVPRRSSGSAGARGG